MEKDRNESLYQRVPPFIRGTATSEKAKVREGVNGLSFGSWIQASWENAVSWAGHAACMWVDGREVFIGFSAEGNHEAIPLRVHPDL